MFIELSEVEEGWVGGLGMSWASHGLFSTPARGKKNNIFFFVRRWGGGTSCFLYILFAFVLFKRLSDLLDFFPFVIKCNLRRTESIPFWLIIAISDTDE